MSLSESPKSLAFVFRRAPHGSLHVQEFLDIVLIAGAFDQQVALYFLDQGVQALRTGQQPESVGLKHIAPLFAALELYGIKQIYVDQQSLACRGLLESDLVIPVSVESRQVLMQRLQEADHVFSS